MYICDNNGGDDPVIVIGSSVMFVCVVMRCNGNDGCHWRCWTVVMVMWYVSITW